MNRHNGILNFFIYVILLLSVTNMSYAQETVHIVQRGETIFSLSRTYKITMEDLMRHNGMTDARTLREGQRLVIPGGASAASTSTQASGTAVTESRSSSGVTEYRAVRGDTLFGIARQHNISLQELRSANNLSESYMLKEGDLLKIPVPGAIRETRSSASENSQTVVQTVAPSVSRPLEQKRLDPSIRWPVSAKEVLYMTGKLYGVVILGERSEPVRSLTQGVVVSAGPYRGFGRVVIVQVAGGYLYVYGGCESLSVKEGDKVMPGTELGRLGIDAVSRQPQLFFMVYKNNTPIDPATAPRS